MSIETITWPDGEVREQHHPCPAHVAKSLRAGQLAEKYPNLRVVAAEGGFDLVGQTCRKTYRYRD